MVTLTQSEIDERVAILRKLKKALRRQRDKFERYLLVLEHQENDIRNGEMEKLAEHIELEHSIVKEILAVQRVIDPLHDMYRMAYPNDEDREIPALRTSLEKLKNQVLSLNKDNQSLLKERMGELRQKIRDLRVKTPRRSVYASQPTPGLVDITT